MVVVVVVVAVVVDGDRERKRGRSPGLEGVESQTGDSVTVRGQSRGGGKEAWQTHGGSVYKPPTQQSADGQFPPWHARPGYLWLLVWLSTNVSHPGRTAVGCPDAIQRDADAARPPDAAPATTLAPCLC